MRLIDEEGKAFPSLQPAVRFSATPAAGSTPQRPLARLRREVVRLAGGSHSRAGGAGAPLATLLTVLGAAEFTPACGMAMPAAADIPRPATQWPLPMRQKIVGLKAVGAPRIAHTGINKVRSNNKFFVRSYSIFN